jgi:hypothetical protein
MKSSQRIKLQQLSSSRKLFLIKQNEQLKNNNPKSPTETKVSSDSSIYDPCSTQVTSAASVDELEIRKSCDSAPLSPIRLSSSMSKMPALESQANQNRMSRVGSMAIEYDFMTWQQAYQSSSETDTSYSHLLNNSPWQVYADDRASRARERDTPYYYVERLKNR